MTDHPTDDASRQASTENSGADTDPGVGTASTTPSAQEAPAATEQSPTSPTTPSATPSRTPVWRKRRVQLGAAAAALLLVGGLGGWAIAAVTSDEGHDHGAGFRQEHGRIFGPGGPGGFGPGGSGGFGPGGPGGFGPGGPGPPAGPGEHDDQEGCP